MSFDMAEHSGRDFEYTTLLLLMAGQVVSQFEQRQAAHPSGGGEHRSWSSFSASAKLPKGTSFQARGVTAWPGEAKVSPGLLTRLLGSLGFGLEGCGGYQCSPDNHRQDREGDCRGFLDAVDAVLRDEADKVEKSQQRKGSW